MKIGHEDPTNQMAHVSKKRKRKKVQTSIGYYYFFFFLQCTGRGTHVHPVVSSEVENIVCSQPSTCLTCWPWCYSVQPCHRMTSLTHCSLSSLPLQPTLLLLTHWHKFCLTVRVCHPSVRSPRSVLFFTFLQPSLVQGPYFFLSHLSSISAHTVTFSFSLYLPFLCFFSQTYPSGPWRAAGADSCISSRLRGHLRSAPLRLNSTVWATETKREEEEGVVNGKYWKTEIGNGNIYGYTVYSIWREKDKEEGSNETELWVKWNVNKTKGDTYFSSALNVLFPAVKN